MEDWASYLARETAQASETTSGEVLATVATR